MNVYALLNLLEAELEKGSVPRGRADLGKCVDIVAEIRHNIPAQIKESEDIIRKRDHIISQAETESRDMLEDANNQIKHRINEHEITQHAYAQSQEILANAQRNAREIRMGAVAYAEDVLLELEDYIRAQIDIVRENRQELKHTPVSSK